LDLLIRCNSPHATPGGCARAIAAIHSPRHNYQGHGVSPAVVEGGVDSADRRPREILEAAGIGGEELGSTGGLSSYLHLYAPRRPRTARAPWVSRSRQPGQSHFCISSPGVYAIPLRQRISFPLDAARVFPRFGTAIRLAS